MGGRRRRPAPHHGQGGAGGLLDLPPAAVTRRRKSPGVLTAPSPWPRPARVGPRRFVALPDRAGRGRLTGGVVSEPVPGPGRIVRPSRRRPATLPASRMGTAGPARRRTRPPSSASSPPAARQRICSRSAGTPLPDVSPDEGDRGPAFGRSVRVPVPSSPTQQPQQPDGLPE